MNTFTPVALITVHNPKLDYHMNDLRMKELARHLRKDGLHPNALTRVVNETETIPYYIVAIKDGNEDTFKKVWHYAQAFDMPSILGVDANQKSFRININGDLVELQKVKSTLERTKGSFTTVGNRSEVYYVVE
jgi:hypothetical protein